MADTMLDRAGNRAEGASVPCRWAGGSRRPASGAPHRDDMNRVIGVGRLGELALQVWRRRTPPVTR